MLEAVGNAERERAAAPGEAPLSEWEVTRIKPDYAPNLTTQVLLANSDEAKAALQVTVSRLSITSNNNLDEVQNAIHSHLVHVRSSSILDPADPQHLSQSPWESALKGYDLFRG